MTCSQANDRATVPVNKPWDIVIEKQPKWLSNKVAQKTSIHSTEAVLFFLSYVRTTKVPVKLYKCMFFLYMCTFGTFKMNKLKKLTLFVAPTTNQIHRFGQKSYKRRGLLNTQFL